MSTIPLADAPALRARGQLTFVIRAALAAVALGATIAFFVVSRHPSTRTVVPLPRNASTVVVLDVSASISTDTYARIGGTLAALSHSGARVGLVVFSDIAYEALPPGVPASDLDPFVRYFTLPHESQLGAAPTFPPNPWTNTFTAGTRISSGMELAHTIAQAQSRRPTVVLVSDLDDDPGDVPRLASVLLAYRRDHVPVRIVGLDPSPGNVALFKKLLSPAPIVAQAPLLSEAPPHDVTPFPWSIVALVLVAAAALALRLAWAPQLQWGTE